MHVTRETRADHASIIDATVVRLPGLRRQRLLAALTQEELAAKAGVRRGTVNRIEQGKETSPPTVRKLADALSCEPRDLIEPESA
jgi:transcriptional regulator with XRE-family HTH domain